MLYIKSASKIKKIATFAVLASQALVLSLVEVWIPLPTSIPGIKLGLANIVTLLLLIFFSLSDVLILVFIKSVVASLFIGGPVMFMFSICAGIVSTIVMWILLKGVNKWFSIVGISIMGSVTHNFSQIMVACFILNDFDVLAYLPILVISGIFTGSFVGCCCSFLIKPMRRLNIITRSSYSFRI